MWQETEDGFWDCLRQFLCPCAVLQVHTARWSACRYRPWQKAIMSRFQVCCIQRIVALGIGTSNKGWACGEGHQTCIWAARLQWSLRDYCSCTTPHLHATLMCISYFMTVTCNTADNSLEDELRAESLEFAKAASGTVSYSKRRSAGATSLSEIPVDQAVAFFWQECALQRGYSWIYQPNC